MSSTSGLPDTETALQNFASTFAAAWNRHDAKGLAELFLEDADLIDPAGQSAQGKEEIESLLAAQHSHGLQNSQIKQNVMRIRVLAPDLVISTNKCDMTGMPNIAGQTPPATIVTFVLRNHSGSWRILTARPMAPVVQAQ